MSVMVTPIGPETRPAGQQDREHDAGRHRQHQPFRVWTMEVERYSTNHSAPRPSRVAIGNCSRRHASANMEAMVIAVGVPQNMNPATPTNIQVDSIPDELSNAGWTMSSSGPSGRAGE